MDLIEHYVGYSKPSELHLLNLALLFLMHFGFHSTSYDDAPVIPPISRKSLQEKNHWATKKIVAHTQFSSPLPLGLRKKSSPLPRRLCPGDKFSWAVALVQANGRRLFS